MTTREVLDQFQERAQKARIIARDARGRKKANADENYRAWQAGYEVATEIYHEDGPDALERMMALKLHLMVENT